MLHYTKNSEVTVFMKNKKFRKDLKALYFDLNSSEMDICVKDQAVAIDIVLSGLIDMVLYRC